ncbi:PREDICTED: growth-regulating factor 7 [Tarenaya hassleriana]|uniref:growth-regulating factor 7 n=1 Tax=Tarenaya hassleriana TaxID=28532 RepID=UPI00053CA220|nr:PREDICTED: growth-regulating factor 7 [Tarenaya hassleriana]
MDVLCFSDKTTGYRTDLQMGLNLQHKEPSFGHRDMEIHHFSKAGALGYCYPFTHEQMKELERQAMIYKYMMASIPVPFDLLIASTSSSYNPKVTGDSEPGRCRRTDGKKWRCSRDVVPNHKYCERHLHRGRPRSRKHVEPSRRRLPYARGNNNGSSDKTRDSGAAPRLSLNSIGNHSSYGVEPRGSFLWDTKKGDIFPMETETEQNSKYLNFIDVWSEGVAAPDEQHCSTPVFRSSVSTNRDPSLTSLELSMGGNNLVDDEMGWIQMGLGVTGYGGSSTEIPSWLTPAATPGGPLAEILRPTPIFTSSVGDGESCYCLTATATSSSTSGAMKRTTASLSDGSSQS